MLKRIQHLRRDERGMSFVFVGVGFMAFLTATTLAIDVGMFMTARSQAQNAADSGALAGAVALVFNDFDDRSPSGPAVQSAINTATATGNPVMSSAASVVPADVTFPVGPTGLSNRVRVNVYRTGARSNPVPTMMAAIFGLSSVDIRAMATAEASPADAADCLLPFTLPDKWNEVIDGPWNTDSTFDMYDKKNNLLDPHDIYVKGEGGTGYIADLDKGTLLTLKPDNGGKPAPSMYQAWAIPGSDGADDYRDAIAGCNKTVVRTDSLMTLEPGNMTGPTRDGVNDLVAQDPGAHWDGTCNCVKGSAYGISPRIRPIPLYDPVYYEEGKHNGRNADLKMISMLGFFVVGMDGNNVLGRIHPITAKATGSGTTSSFAMAIRLVE
jgi:hypothetical protein